MNRKNVLFVLGPGFYGNGLGFQLRKALQSLGVIDRFFNVGFEVKAIDKHFDRKKEALDLVIVMVKKADRYLKAVLDALIGYLLIDDQREADIVVVVGNLDDAGREGVTNWGADDCLQYILNQDALAQRIADLLR